MFVTFEGPEGGGKSTLIQAISEHLKREGRSVVVTREPGSGKVGATIRDLLLHGEHLDPRTELFLFLADRAQHGATVIRPALDRGDWVLCDRYADSTVVYQGHARGFPLDQLRSWNDFATQGLRPDLTLLLDLPPEIGLSRIRSKDRLDQEPLEFHRKVRDGFLSEAARDPARWAILPADESPETVLQMAMAELTKRAGRPSP
jgi:dTMP kinase